MALGTITLADKASRPIFYDHISVPGDGSYPTGGTVDFEGSFQAATGVKGGREVDAVIDVGGDASTYLLYNKATDKLMAFVRTTGVEVANAVNLSGTTFKLLVISH